MYFVSTYRNILLHRFATIYVRISYAEWSLRPFWNHQNEHIYFHDYRALVHSSNYKRTTGQLAIWLTINDCLRESRMIHKSSPADLAQKIDIAYFPYTERLSCPYTKTTICLIRSFKFIELWEIFWSPQRTLVATHIKAQIYGLTLEVNYTKNVRSFIKQTPKPVELSPFELPERLL